MPRLPALMSVLLLVLASPAVADDDLGPVPDVAASAIGPTAEEWLRVGLERYERGNLIGAIEAFERGYQKEARPVFLFALGQAHRKRGDCDRARAMFDAYLATSPTEAQADAAHQQRETCEPAKAVVEEAPPPPPPPPPPPQVLVVTERAHGTPWYRDPIALTSSGATLALVGTGVGLWLAADRAASGAASATTYDRHAQLRERAESRQLQASIAFGGAAVVAGVTVWAIARDRGEHVERTAPRAAIQPVIGAGGIGLALGGRF
jgi:hypothetical protein